MKRSASAAEGDGPIFAIGDVHGCSDELDELLGKLPLTEDSTLVFVGDYIDRGPKSRQVIEQLIDLRRQYSVIALIGNHEDMFLDFLADPASTNAINFIYSGGGATLAAYSDGTGAYYIPSEHLEFLRRLPLTWQSRDHFFVHAGLPEMTLDELDADVMRQHLLWLREPFLDSDYVWSKIVVHGHSVVQEVDIRSNRINVDTGCAMGGHLSAIELPSQHVYTVARREAPTTIVLKDPSRRIAVRFPGHIPVHVTVGDTTLVVDSVNYNEFGVLLCDTALGQGGFFLVGDPIEGTLLVSPHVIVPFRGIVVRVSDTPRGLFYGVRFDGPVQIDL